MLCFQSNTDFYVYEEVACRKKEKRYQELAEHSTYNNKPIKPSRKMEKWGKRRRGIKERG